MSEQHTYTVAPGVRSIRADKALAVGFPEHSRSALQRAFDAGLVLRDGKPIKRDATVQGGDVIVYSMPEIKASELKAVKIPLDILFEDKHMLAINKPAGMVVHPGAATGEDTLVHALLAHCKGSLSGIGGVARPGIVHRLDRETSGVIVVAKTDAAHRGLAEQFSARSLQKEYLALVNGAPSLLSGSIMKPIGRHPTHRHKMMAFEDTPVATVIEERIVETVFIDEDGFYDLDAEAEEAAKVARGVKPGARDAHTDWEVVESYGKIAALVRCMIHTGRTHQIRVHLKSIGHILMGDVVYGWKPDARVPAKSQPKRVMLHAAHLVVKHPVTGKQLDLRAPVPKDFTAMMKALKAAAKVDEKKTAPAKDAVKRAPASYFDFEKQ